MLSCRIESLEEITKAHIGKICPSVNGNISRLQKLLDISFHFDDEEDVFESINDAIEDSQETITKKIDNSKKALSEIYTQIETILTQLKFDFENADKRINATAKNNKEELLSNASNHFKKLCELIYNLKVTFDTSTKEIKAVISDFQSSIFNELDSLSTLIKESFEQSEKKSEDIQCSLFS